MKKLIFLTTLLSFIEIKAQVHVAVEQPELNVLYLGYDNIIIPMASGAEENKLSAEGATLTPTRFQGKKGYLVRPSSSSKVIPIVHEAKINGEWARFDTTFYIVKPFPKPEIYNQTISKSSGVNIHCGLPTSAPFRRSYEVLNVNLQDKEYTGAIIPGKAVKSMKVGNRVGATIIVKDILSGEEITIMTAFKVTN
jgi:hypothetical protein